MINLINIILFVFTNNKIHQGFDERINKNININITEYAKINKIFNYNKLLNKLESNIDKTQKFILAKEFLEMDDIKMFNLKAGGLYDEFYF
jgi:hypothetical protein